MSATTVTSVLAARRGRRCGSGRAAPSCSRSSRWPGWRCSAGHCGFPRIPTIGQHGSDAPFLFMAILPLLVGVVAAQFAEGGMDAKALAILGVLSAVNAAIRPALSAGTAGIESVFFLLILAGRVFGPGFGFLLGCTSLFTSALLTAGIGPWLPFQMITSGWIGLGAGLLPPLIRGRREIVMLAGYGVRRRLRVRDADEPVVLAVRHRQRYPGRRRVAVLHPGRLARREPAPVPGLHPADLDRRLGHRPGDHELRSPSWCSAPRY